MFNDILLQKDIDYVLLKQILDDERKQREQKWIEKIKNIYPDINI